ncbi:hypothetical protein SAMN02745225_02354 [Ferrithrix thermotolerans DSM 19514]|uniref:Uncharacterized protein n=1 Tax=Ferrithrix thermotolerans DSM 19514 TaxID=1121881 RepID=A0A1M4YJQ7_9ACTN|nr:hypothetical protein SAMN02745225_02354 [Ferrithrix thermotolerans DSM 19514]
MNAEVFPFNFTDVSPIVDKFEPVTLSYTPASIKESLLIPPLYD